MIYSYIRSISSLLSIFILLFVFTFEVEAATFTISGTLQTTIPSSNSYGANYMISTPQGVYYFDLDNAAYANQVGNTVAFIVEGTANDYVVVSSTSAPGSSTGSVSSSQTLPLTGMPLSMLFGLGVLACGVGYGIHKFSKPLLLARSRIIKG